MKVGILGLGRAGRRHAWHAQALGHEVLWSDPKVEGLDRPGRCATPEEVMDLVDAVVIATPTDSHARYLHEAVVRSRPVLVEKPIGAIGTSVLVADSLIAADTAGIRVATGFNLRCHPQTKLLKQLPRPYYGHFICAQYTENTADGVVNHWASHEIDLAQYLFGSLRLLDHHVGSLAVDLYLVNWATNARVHIHSDMIAKDRVRGATLIAADGWASVDYEWHPVEEEHYKNMLDNFLVWVESGERFHLATGWDGYHTLKICEKASATNIQRDP
jgi:predicted dehydrogenase